MFSIGSFDCGDGDVVTGIVGDGQVVRLDRVPGRLHRASVASLLARWDEAFPALVDLLAAPPAGAVVDVGTLQPTVPWRPGKLLQSAANYRKHVIDLIVAGRRDEGDEGVDLEQVRAEAAAMMDARAAHGRPTIFIGLPSSMCGPGDDVVLPPVGKEHDWELELGVVIGRPAYQIQPEGALDHVAAYVTVNDLTTRDLVFGEGPAALGADWFRAKNAPTFFPTGPWLVPAAFVPDPSALRITLRHNGDVMQDESTADMIVGVGRLIAAAAETVPLEPGDLLLTGSPAGNGAHWGRRLQAGDVMEGAITGDGVTGPGFGVQRNRCRSWTPD